MNLRKYFETLPKNGLLIAVTLLLVTSHIFGQLHQFMLQGREYRQEEGKWYTFVEGRKGDQIIPQRLIVRLKDRGFMESFDFQRLNISGVSLGSPRFLGGFYVLSIAPERDPFQIAFILQRSDLFDILEFDALGQRCDTPNDPQYSQQWNLPHIQMPQAWDIKTGNSSIILGIIDSGIRYTHEDLDGNTWVNPLEDQNGNGKPDFSPVSQGGDLDGIDNDGNSFVDDLIGWDFAGGGNSPQPPYQPDNNPDDTDGHGTNVAGVSSAQTNNYENGAYKGIAGVAGGWGNQKGVSLIVLRDGGFEPIHSLTAQAIEYAAENGARVINISSGFATDYTNIRTSVNLAVNTYGVVVCASAGNNGNDPDPSIRYPARYSNTVAVGATDQNDNRRDYSAYGPEINVVAPDGVPTTTMAGGYTFNVTGTSFSAPHVAGLAGLIRSINPDLSNSQTVTIMENSAVDLGDPGFDNFYGHGRIDAFEALKQTPTWNNVIQNDFYGDDDGFIQYESNNFNSPYTIPNYYWQQEVSAINQNNNGIDFIFSHWSDGIKQKYRQLPLQNNGNYTAFFTGHMKSLSPTALTHNGGRKVWTTSYWDGETGPGYRVVYEDNGDIYYTEYLFQSFPSPGFYYWSDEVLLSDGSGNNKNPSITANVRDHVCVVWQQYDPSLNKYHIKYREAYLSNWNSPVTISTTTTASEPQPVVGSTYWSIFPPPYYLYSWHFVWNNGSGLKYALADQSGVSYIVDIEGTDANCRNPSITDNWYSTIGITWDRNGTVYYQEVQYGSPGDPYNPIGSPVNLSCGIVGSETPCISQAYYNANIMMLTWTAKYEFETCNAGEKLANTPTEAVGNKIIVARRKDENGQWGKPRYIQYGSNKENIIPSVGYNDIWPDPYFHVIWEVQNENKLAKLDYLEGQGWDPNSQAQIFTGTGIKTPSMSSIGASGASAVWAVNSASPFDIVHQTITPTTESLEQTSGTDVFREGIIHLSQINPLL